MLKSSKIFSLWHEQTFQVFTLSVQVPKSFGDGSTFFDTGNPNKKKVNPNSPTQTELRKANGFKFLSHIFLILILTIIDGSLKKEPSEILQCASPSGCQC
jgi:hypothetical protein